jgi:hypothetical protein
MLDDFNGNRVTIQLCTNIHIDVTVEVLVSGLVILALPRRTTSLLSSLGGVTT